MSGPRASTTTLTMSPTQEKKSRQRPGSACLGCRDKKLKCDGKQPQCGACFGSGTRCIIPTTQAPRGPQKGHLKALQSRIDMLEQRLLEPQINFIPDVPNMDLGLDEAFSMSMDYLFSTGHTPLPSPPISLGADPMHERKMDPLVPDLPDPSTTFVISELLRADLDQLYFERTHRFVPLLHQRRYFSWARSPIKTESQICLQHAMWTSAASLSSQLQHIRESLYDSTLKLLEALEARDTDVVEIEHVQARILITLYDFMRSNHRRGWMSAGRCFRLLQLMRLFEIDHPERSPQLNSLDGDSWILTEEKRRTFWMAYCLDLFISLRREWPLTLHEHIKFTRLPMPDEDFQSSNYTEMGFLTDELTSLDQLRCSPFTESIISATIYRRAITHRQQAMLENVQGNASQEFWNRHNWLNEMITNRLDNLSLNYPTSSQHSHPLLLFTSMVTQSTVLCLCDIAESMRWDTDEYQNALTTLQHRALLAAHEIVGLSRSLAQLSYLKIHPFTPLPLILCVEFFNKHTFLDESIAPQVRELHDLLKDMNIVNNIARDLLLS